MSNLYYFVNSWMPARNLRECLLDYPANPRLRHMPNDIGYGGQHVNQIPKG